METVDTLILGAGISGLATAAFLRNRDFLVLEADDAPGGYCKTIQQDGFTWDYSGHFFHFKHAALESWLRQRMPGQDVRTVEKRSSIEFAGTRVDFPFQKNIHQLPREDFLECLHDLYFANHGEQRPAASFHSFKDMLFARFGKGISERFLIPYNEKLYATDLALLDQHAMGRFFPHASVADVISNMRHANNTSYNSTFTYPAGGAIQYVNALLSAVPRENVALGERAVSVDLSKREVTTNKRTLRYNRLVSSAPFNRLLGMCHVPHDVNAFSWNKVLVFNLGFDRKGERDIHWLYVPDRSISFYRVGFYDNIFNADRLSLYVELGYARDAAVDPEEMLPRVLEDLRKVGITQEHRLVSEHHVVMDPAYVHITRASLAEFQRTSRILAAHGVFPLGRYGGWTYCSIEDNMVEAHALAGMLDPQGRHHADAPHLGHTG